MLYKWATEYCPNVKYVLKADDDVFVDTFHLPRFLKTHEFEDKQDFFLCMVLKGYVPRRNVDDKWFVTREDFSGDEYPPYVEQRSPSTAHRRGTHGAPCKRKHLIMTLKLIQRRICVCNIFQM